MAIDRQLGLDGGLRAASRAVVSRTFVAGNWSAPKADMIQVEPIPLTANKDLSGRPMEERVVQIRPSKCKQRLVGPRRYHNARPTTVGRRWASRRLRRRKPCTCRPNVVFCCLAYAISGQSRTRASATGGMCVLVCEGDQELRRVYGPGQAKRVLDVSVGELSYRLGFCIDAYTVISFADRRRKASRICDLLGHILCLRSPDDLARIGSVSTPAS